MDPIFIVGTALAVLFSLTSHEAAHAWTADRLGDPGPRLLGRVTLNPIPHIDPFLTILLPAVLLLSGTGVIFGGAKPVTIQLDRLRKPRRDWALVSFAGPASNLLMAVLFAGALAGLLRLGALEARQVGAMVLVVGLYTNVLLAVLNLLPIPPLDGSRIVAAALRGRVQRIYLDFGRFGLFVLLALMFLVPGSLEALWDGIRVTTERLTAVFGIEREVRQTVASLSRMFRAG